MGSNGSGRLTDYPGTSLSTKENGASAQAPEDRCARAFGVHLEDIEQSEYFGTHRTQPPIGTLLDVAQRKRIVAQTRNGEIVGNLPTLYNYLAACMKDGWSYFGAVRSTNDGPPVASIAVDFLPNRQNE